MEEDSPNELGIKIENGDKNTITNYRLNLMDLNEETASRFRHDFSTRSSLCLQMTFQKICRDMNNLSECIEIKSVDNQLIFSCKGDFCKSRDDNGRNLFRRHLLRKITVMISFRDYLL